MAASRPTPTVVPHDAAALAAVMDELVAAGKGWLNLLPQIPDDVAVPSTPNALAVFSKRGPVVPLGTWTAPTTSGRGAHTSSELGIQHGAAKRAVDALVERSGPAVPDGWAVLSDHPRRGVVVRPADGASTLDQARWLLDALAALCIPPRTDSFLLFRYGG